MAGPAWTFNSFHRHHSDTFPEIGMCPGNIIVTFFRLSKRQAMGCVTPCAPPPAGHAFGGQRADWWTASRCDSVCPRSGHLAHHQATGPRKIPPSRARLSSRSARTATNQTTTDDFYRALSISNLQPPKQHSLGHRIQLAFCHRDVALNNIGKDSVKFRGNISVR